MDVADIVITIKIASFCRELAHNTLATLARDEGQSALYARARAALGAGNVGQALEADLDALHAIALRRTGHGLYPSSLRGFSLLPGTSASHGAQQWSCPQGLCAGRGRVVPGRPVPTCSLTGRPLTAKPLGS
ncbi:hypothetical protein FNH09_07160 [Streptomyces adustus]|uniref:Uncharacterized protein n=1 Tax=Streptomyces adustus TaxID=1609272 RepID=A0A5N8V7G1_9ACTN|nr:hypothetical protein [Streptomyces adustus]MPY31107.1 hypothetical protein [Streptomyces adustus]